MESSDVNVAPSKVLEPGYKVLSLSLSLLRRATLFLSLSLFSNSPLHVPAIWRAWDCDERNRTDRGFLGRSVRRSVGGFFCPRCYPRWNTVHALCLRRVRPWRRRAMCSPRLVSSLFKRFRKDMQASPNFGFTSVLTPSFGPVPTRINEAHERKTIPHNFSLSLSPRKLLGRRSARRGSLQPCWMWDTNFSRGGQETRIAPFALSALRSPLLAAALISKGS